MNTNWLELRQQFHDWGVTPPDESGPARLSALLSSLGIGCEEENGLVYITCPDLNRGRQVALVSMLEAVIVPGYDVSRRIRDDPAHNLYRKVNCWSEMGSREFGGPNDILVVVDLDGLLAQEGNQLLARHLEINLGFVRKIVCPAAEWLTRVTNPFGASVVPGHWPELYSERMDVLKFESPERTFDETVTHHLKRDEHVLDRVNQHQKAGQVCELANQLIRRLLGAGISLIPGSDVVHFVDYGRPFSLPLYATSMSQRVGISFCASLALAAEELSSTSWIGLTEDVNYLDSSSFLLLVDILRDAMIAKGANIYLKTNKSSYRELFAKKLKMKKFPAA